MPKSWVAAIAVLTVALLTYSARADIPIQWGTPDEASAKDIARNWLEAVKAGNTETLTQLAAFDLHKQGYLQVTVPADGKLAKKCGKPGLTRNAKGMPATLKCLLTPDLMTALGAVDVATAAGFSYATKLKEVTVDSKQWSAAAKQLKRLERDHAFVSITGIAGDGVWHQLVLAVSYESATGSNRVAAVVHWTTPR